MKNKLNEKNHKTQNTTRTSKGITLVALVITVIILLILAGVAINMAVNSDGLFAKANEAVTKWNQSVAEEENIVENLLQQANEINGGGAGGEEDTLPAGWDSTKIASTIKETSEVTGTTKEREVPIPKGFTPSQVTGENTIAGGLVIYQTETPVTADNHDTALTKYNQYVWIPVDDINDMVMCKGNTGASRCNIVLQADGTLQCTNSDHTTNKTNLCGRLYGVDSTTTDTASPYTYTTTMNFDDRSQRWTDNSGYREPADLTHTDSGDASSTGITEIKKIIKNTTATTYDEIKDAWLAMQQEDYKNMAVSVAKYGGFYVSRYEAGANGASKKNQLVLTAATDSSDVYIGVNNWYGLYNTLRQEIKQGETKILQSHMIYGSQYDQIIKFVGKEAQKGHPEKQTTEQKTTGYEGDSDILKNIYDLEGNNREWTAQAHDTDGRVYRGSSHYGANNGNFYSASLRNSYNPTNTNSNITSRLVLYL